MALAAGMSPPSSAARMRVEETGRPSNWGHGQDVHFHPQGLAELLQQGGVPGGPGPKGEVFAAETLR